MKRLLTATALIALAPAMASADYTFALVPKAMNNPFFDLARDGCYKAQEELDDVTCEYIGPGEHTELEQIQIVQDLITRGVDGIAVAPSNAPAMGKVLQDAEAAGIPVITWDSDLLPLSEVEKRHIEAVLRATGGNRTRAARILGIGLRTLQRRLKSYPPSGTPN